MKRFITVMFTLMMASLAVHGFAAAYKRLTAPVITEDRGTKYLRKNSQSIVKITYLNNPKSGGTGFQVKAASGDSVVVTNAHVCGVQSFGQVAAHWDNGKYTILRVLEVDEKHDLCVLTPLPGSVPALEIATNEAQLYDRVFVIGHPLLVPNTYAEGHVREREPVFIGDKIVKTKAECDELGLEPEIAMGWFGPMVICGRHFDAIGMSTLIYPGNSGSPVFNAQGQVVGVVFAGDSRSNQGFYVPLEYLEGILAKY